MFSLILFCLLMYFALNFCFNYLLTVLFNNLTAFFFEETLSFVGLKARYKMFVLYLRKVSLIKYVATKTFRWSAEKRFIKGLRVYISVISIL